MDNKLGSPGSLVGKFFYPLKHADGFKAFSLTMVWVWLSLFALVPFCLVVMASFLSQDETHLVALPFTLENYTNLFDTIYLQIFARSFVLAGISTLICLLMAYPFAYFISRLPEKTKGFLVLLVVIPFWTSSLIRSYSLIAILKTKGLINAFLLWAGIIHAPLQILFTHTAVVVGLVYNLLPFMILPILTNIERLDNRLLDAARDLGATRFTIFRRVVVPLTIPGIVAGCTLVFLPAMTIFYIPEILGGAKSVLMGNLIQREFLSMHNWPQGAATSILLIGFLALLVGIYRKTAKDYGEANFL